MSLPNPGQANAKPKSWMRKKKKLQDDEPELESEFRSVDGEELESLMERMFDDMNLTEEMRRPLRCKDTAGKREMLRNFNKKSQQKHGPNSPAEFVESMKATERPAVMLELITTLRVSLTNRAVSWLRDFADKGGLDLLMCLLKECQYVESSLHNRLEHECVRCLKAFMNNKHGLSQVLGDDNGMATLARSLHPSKPQIMTEVLRIMAAMSLVPPHGHDKALEALTLVGEFREIGRFSVLIDALSLDVGGTKNHLLQLACIQFINAIITTPDDLDFRIHLRNEVIRAGLDEVLSNLPDDPGDDLTVQLEVFEYHREEDVNELQGRLGDIKVELDDPYELFGRLLTMSQETPSYPHFLSMLQHLIMLPNEDIVRSQYMVLFEEFISQVTLFHGGIHPDFGLRKFDIDVDAYLEAAVSKATVESSSRKADALMTQMEEHDKAAMEKEKKLSVQIAELKAQLEKGGIRVSVPTTAGTSPTSAESTALASSGEGAPPPPPPPPPGPGGAAPPPPPPPPGPGGAGGAGGGPPPPPPPPGMGGGPPPPPGMGGMGNPAAALGIVKKKYEPKTQMKRLNWTKVNTRVLTKKSFWARVNEDQLGSDSLFAALSMTFAAKAPKKKADDAENTEEKKPAKKVKELRVLDPKSAQNLSIMLGSMRLDYEVLKKRIVTLDSELELSTISSLVKYLPLDEQMRQLVLFRNSYDSLADSEQFCVVVGSIPRLSQRLSAMAIRLKFDEEVDDVLPDIEAVISACEEVQGDSFLAVLQLVLLFGNFMNAGSRNQQSFGFELSFLTKLNNTKSVDNSMNLVHFLETTITDNYPEMNSFVADLAHVQQAAKVSEDSVQKTLSTLKKNVAEVRTAMKSKEGLENGDKFHELMEVFIKDAEERVSVATSRFEKMKKMIESVAEFFCVDLKKQPIEEMFTDIFNFRETYVLAKKENEKRKEAELKKKRLLELEKEKQKKKNAKFAAKVQLVDITAEGDQQGVLDGLMEALSSGSAFKRSSGQASSRRARSSMRRAGPRSGDKRPSEAELLLANMMEAS